MTKPEQRALEIYITLLIQFIRRNNPNAIQDIKNFFRSVAFLGNYDAEYLIDYSLKHIEELDILPSRLEVALALKLNTPNILYIKNRLKLLYNKAMPNNLIRANYFSERPVKLQPKIKDTKYHSELLTFLKDFVIISKTIPVKKEHNMKDSKTTIPITPN